MPAMWTKRISHRTEGWLTGAANATQATTEPDLIEQAKLRA